MGRSDARSSSFENCRISKCTGPSESRARDHVMSQHGARTSTESATPAPLPDRNGISQARSAEPSWAGPAPNRLSVRAFVLKSVTSLFGAFVPVKAEWAGRRYQFYIEASGLAFSIDQGRLPSASCQTAISMPIIASKAARAAERLACRRRSTIRGHGFPRWPAGRTSR